MHGVVLQHRQFHKSPVGPSMRFSYQGREGKDTCVHAECMAQVLIQDRDWASMMVAQCFHDLLPIKINFKYK